MGIVKLISGPPLYDSVHEILKLQPHIFKLEVPTPPMNIPPQSSTIEKWSKQSKENAFDKCLEDEISIQRRQENDPT